MPLPCDGTTSSGSTHSASSGELEASYLGYADVLSMDDVIYLYILRYTCTCERKFEGDDCSTVINTTGKVVAGIMITLILGGIVAFGAYKHRVKMIKMKAFDFFAELERLKDSGDIDCDGGKSSGRASR